MKIYLIRHGETTGDIEDRFGGDYDDHLTEKGRQQSQDLAKKLQNKNIEIIYASSKMRARETADEIAKSLSIPVEIMENLKERNNYGVLTGMTKSEAKQKHPVDFEKISKDKTYHDVTGSESYDDIKTRCLKVFEEILQSGYNTIAIISHGGIISTYVREFLTEGKNIKLGDCSILEITKMDDKFSLSCLYGAEFQH